ncbi:hypothetical protein EYZ11_000880 [Aspergillus tanneri]|uniref:Terpene cyclase n=1 Tax=Aspergillus tanneri TaxID=1220188 RepID=A0A4S3JW36_9EURO|nr:hypothetical protein EYZ11_000880 [Aspergillus tanneri]
MPNLSILFPGWKCQIHKEYERARDESLNPWLQHWIEDEATYQKLQAAEFGIFAAILCAEFTFEKLCTVAKYFTWFFIWDDIFDCGYFEHDEIGLAAYRETSAAYFKSVLRGQGEYPDLSGWNNELRNALQCWDEGPAKSY